MRGRLGKLPLEGRDRCACLASEQATTLAKFHPRLFSEPPMSDLNEWLSLDALEDYAGDVIYQRGAAYFRQGAVGRLRDAGSKVSARVHGTETYSVELWTDGAEFHYDCTCFHAAEGNFCKHCVAAGLAFLDGREKGYRPGSEEDDTSQIRRYLELQAPETLIDWLLDAASQDDGLFRKLLLKAKGAGGMADIVKTFRREIDNATRLHGFLEYDEAREFADELAQLVDSMEELQTPESANLLVELAEYAILKIAPTLDEMEEYDEVGDVLDRLQGLHHEACEAARPDPVLLAERLFRYEIEERLDVFYGSLEAYQDVLGPSGLRRFQELAQSAWQDMARPGNRDDYDSQCWRLSEIMESLARASGDVEALVAIKARDLSFPERYLEIAKVYQNAGQPDKALAWAERGLQAFPDHYHDTLRDFLVEEYLKRGRAGDALELVWIRFTQQPRLEYYQKLHQLAEPLGLWPKLRELALAELEAAAQQAMAKPSLYQPKPAQPDHSERVRVALWEKDVDSAWQAVQTGTCRPELRLKVADALVPTRPDAALEVYLPAVEHWVGQTNNEGYSQALGLIRKIQPLMPAESFALYLTELRNAFKAKRNFIKLLDTLKLAGR